MTMSCPVCVRNSWIQANKTSADTALFATDIAMSIIDTVRYTFRSTHKMRTGLQSSTMHSDRYWNVSVNSRKIISYSAVTARLFCLTSEPMECICFGSREASANGVWKEDKTEEQLEGSIESI